MNLYAKWRNGDKMRVPSKLEMAMWNATIMLTESNQGGKATNKGLVKWRLGGSAIKKAPVKIVEVALPQSTNAHRWNGSINTSVYLPQFSAATKTVLVKLIGKEQWHQSNEVVQLTRDARAKWGIVIQQQNQWWRQWTHAMAIQQLTIVMAECRKGSAANINCASRLRNGGAAIKAFASQMDKWWHGNWLWSRPNEEAKQSMPNERRQHHN